MKLLSVNVGVFMGDVEILPISPGKGFVRCDHEVALSAKHCPVASGSGHRNELGNTCSACIEVSPERAQMCDALMQGHEYHTLPDLTMIAHSLPGWRGRVLRRSGEDRK